MLPRGVRLGVSDTGGTGPPSVAYGGYGTSWLVDLEADGGIVAHVDSYLELDELPAGGAGSFSIDLYGDDCPIGLAATSGYGF
jgi:hypothetical protein